MTRLAGPGRPRAFDEAKALDVIVDVFWERGFEGAAYPDFEAATGLRRQSLIYAFGDKRAMFAKALARYAERREARELALLARPGSAIANVRALFDSWLADARRPERTGCLVVNSLGELGGRDAEIDAILARATEALFDALEAAFRRARAAGEIGPSADPAGLARLAVAAGDGALAHARAGIGSETAAQGFAAFLGLLASHLD